MNPLLHQQFARIEDTHWWFEGRRAVIRAVLRRWLPPGEPRRILDVGCGTGAMLQLLKEFGHVEGLDCSAEALAYSRRRLGDTVPLYQGMLTEGLPPNRTYEAITAFDILEHILDPVPTLRAMRLALAPGGILICTVPAFSFLWGPHDNMNHHYRRYSRRCLTTHLEQAGYRILWASYFNTLLFPPVAVVRLSRRVLGNKEYEKSDFTEVHPLLNWVLANLFAMESWMLSLTSFPFGVSLMAIAEPNPCLSSIAQDASPRPV